MSTNSLSPKLKKLYEEKRFSDLILEIESTTSDENRSAIVSNLLGVSRASIKGRTDRDIQYSLKDFENSFYKDNLGDISLTLFHHRRSLYLEFYLLRRQNLQGCL